MGYFDFNALLAKNKIDSTKSRVLVMRNVPKEPELRKTLPWLAVERPELFTAFQAYQSVSAEKKLTQAAYLASFIGHKPNEALFVSLYSIKGRREVTYKQYWRD